MGSSVSGNGREYHVAAEGGDDSEGTEESPLGSISAAAEQAQPGDTVTVHEGIYRERVDPPRGGDPDERIVYRAADGADVEIRGSEIVEGWEETGDGVWRVTLPGSFFGDYNPFADRIRGDWFDDKGRDHHTGAVYLDGTALPEAPALEDVMDAGGNGRAWYAEVDEGVGSGGDDTTIRADFGGADPTEGTVEVNVRPAVFYPSEPGRDCITVRGFTMRHAATQWAPPTTEQVGLVGTHWSHGWRIEDNVVRDSRCTGITLGKYGSSVDDTGATADRYNETIREARENGWEKGSVGGHLVRNNTIRDCGQAGIVGSMGAAFSEVSGNHVHDINAERAFGGAELAGIKFHGPIDTVLRNNHVHRARRGIWLDWMTQGTRVTRNLLYDNDLEDLFLEVNHGPFVVDNNLFLSGTAVTTWSQGGAYAHNLIAGDVVQEPELGRETPYHEPHSTEIAGLDSIRGGDDRFYNNLFVGGSGLSAYDDAALAVSMADNVFLGGAEPSVHEEAPVASADDDPGLELSAGERVRMHFEVDGGWTAGGTNPLVTTDLLGEAAVPGAPFENPDGSALSIDADYFGEPRDRDDPRPGPFARSNRGTDEWVLWPT